MANFGIGKGGRFIAELSNGTRGANKFNAKIDADIAARGSAAQDEGVVKAFGGDTILIKNGESGFVPATETGGLFQKLDDLGVLENGEARALTDDEKAAVGQLAESNKAEIISGLEAQKRTSSQYGLHATRNKVMLGTGVVGGGVLGWQAISPDDPKPVPPPTVAAQDVLRDPAAGAAADPSGLPPEMLAGLPPELVAQAAATGLPPELLAQAAAGGGLPPELAGAPAAGLPPELAGAPAAGLPPELLAQAAGPGAAPQLAVADGSGGAAAPGFDPTRA